MVIKRKKVIAGLFYAWFIATVFAYIVFAVTALAQNQFVYWEYSKIRVPFPLNYTTHLKDVFMVLLFAALLWKRRIPDSFLGVALLALYCVFITVIQNGKEAFLMIIAGIREFLPLIICLMLRKEEKRSGVPLISDRSFARLLRWCIVIEALFLGVQIARHGMWLNIGKAGNRLPGTMGNGGSLGYFGLASSIFIYCLYSMRQAGYPKTAVFILLTLFVSLASGARNAIFVSLIAIMFFLVELLFSLSMVPRKRVYMLLIPLLVVVGIPLVSIMSAYIGRGKLSVSGGGRIELLKQLFSRPMLQLILGKGLGDRTNSAALLGVNTTISDGTITALIAQFGILGTILCLAAFGYFAFKALKNKQTSRSVMMLLLIGILITVISINVFEQPVLMIMFYLTYCSATRKRVLLSGTIDI